MREIEADKSWDEILELLMACGELVVERNGMAVARIVPVGLTDEEFVRAGISETTDSSLMASKEIRREDVTIKALAHRQEQAGV